MMGTCYFCGERMLLRRSAVMPNVDAAKHLRSCWVHRLAAPSGPQEGPA